MHDDEEEAFEKNWRQSNWRTLGAQGVLKHDWTLKREYSAQNKQYQCVPYKNVWTIRQALVVGQASLDCLILLISFKMNKQIFHFIVQSLFGQFLDSNDHRLSFKKQDKMKQDGDNWENWGQFWRPGTDPINKFLRKFYTMIFFKHFDWLKNFTTQSDCYFFL